MQLINRPIDNKLFIKNFLSFCVIFGIQIMLGVFLIYQIIISQTTAFLNSTAQRVQEDIIYKDNKWDLRRYNTDPSIPDTYPLYVFASDGFVIDRWKPLPGFLDISDTKHLLEYQKAQTITTPTDQTWRILSEPIIINNQRVGVITVARINPTEENEEQVDTELLTATRDIRSKISLVNNKIDTSKLDARDLNIDISFQIVDKFNQIVTKNNNTNSIDRIPNYIEISYVGSVLNGPRVRQAVNPISKEKFLLVTKPLLNPQNHVIGVVVVGKSISFADEILTKFMLIGSIPAIALSFIVSLILDARIKAFVRDYAAGIKAIRKEVQRISFDKKTGKLTLDDNVINIPYATHQYYLCRAVFSAPKKRWEGDELLDMFGENESTNRRKIYDAMLIINKKTVPYMSDRLIISRDRTYHLNENLLSKLS